MNESTDTVTKLLLSCCGYESRCVRHYEQGKRVDAYSTIIIFDYQCNGLHSYDNNRTYIGSLLHEDTRIITNWDQYLANVKEIVLSNFLMDVSVDITSFDRKKMGDIFLLLYHYKANLHRSEIFYYPQKYARPSAHLETVSAFSPLSGSYLAERSLSQAGTTLIAGAGYEFGKIIGALDVLEPDEVFCFIPKSSDDRFEDSINMANNDFEFLSDYPSGMDRLVSYDIYNVSKLYSVLRGLVDHDVGRRNVLILPMGPKIFAFVSILLALQYKNKVMVWRYSTVDSHVPGTTRDAIASGEIIQFSFSF